MKYEQLSIQSKAIALLSTNPTEYTEYFSDGTEVTSDWYEQLLKESKKEIITSKEKEKVLKKIDWYLNKLLQKE